MKLPHTLYRSFVGFAAAALGMVSILPTIAFAVEENSDSDTFEDGILTYTKIDSSTVSVTDCNESTTHISIMPKIDGYDVVSIDEEAFANCTKLQSVTIPVSVTKIGGAAFYGCSALEKITLPETVTAVESGTFFGCSALTEITLGSAVTSIGDMAFGYCTSLTDIALPDSVETVGDQLFYYCTALETAEIPEKVTELGAYTFYGCLSLQEFTVSAALEDIGAMTFLGCSSLKNIAVEEGNSNYTVTDNVLYNADTSVLYLYPAGRTDTAFTLPDSVLAVYAGAFFAASNLQQITFDSKLQYIGEMAFNFCSGLTSLTIPESVTSIGSTAFSDCTGLTAVTFSGTEKEDGGTGEALDIGDYAFFCCDNLKEVTLPKRVSAIGEYAFGCTAAEQSDENSSDEDSTIEVKPLEGFLLIGYTGAASDYVKNSSVDLNFKSVNFDWGKLAFWVIAAAVVLVIVFFAVLVVRRSMMTSTEKEALHAAKQEQKKRLSDRDDVDSEADTPDDGYQGILDDTDEAEEMLSYDETISHSCMHQFGHAEQHEEDN